VVTESKLSTVDVKSTAFYIYLFNFKSKEIVMRCEAVDNSGLDWSFEQEEKMGSWNGRAVKAVADESTLMNLYETNRADRSTVIPVDYYSSNDESYNSFNDPSSQNSRDEPSATSSSYDGNANDNSRSLSDLAKDVTEAAAAARSGNWLYAAAKSLEVAQDAIDIGKDVAEALVESRTDAVQGGYSEYSDLWCQ